MKRKLLFIAGAIALSMLVSCEDNFQEPSPNPSTPPVKNKTVLNFNLDFPLDEIRYVGSAFITYRNVADYYLDDNSLFDIYKEDGFTLNVSVVVPDSLRGQTREALFYIDFFYEGVGRSARLIRDVTFSSGDTTYLGNIGFSNYDWHSVPPLILVIVPDNIKRYATVY